MDYAAGDEYYYNSIYLLVGTFNYTIWTTDSCNNTNSSAGTFDIVDTTLPEITNVQANDTEVNGYVNITATVTDYTLDVVNITLNGTNYTMINAGGDVFYYNTVIYSVLDTYNYTIWANDTSNNTNSSSGTFDIIDTTLPKITDVQAEDTEVNGYVNVSCEIRDNYQIEIVNVSIDGTNYTMINVGGDEYYYNSVYSTIGTYSYTIWVVDSSNNTNSSSGTFDVIDTTKPEINSVSAVNTNVNEYLNITVDVTDNYVIEKVRIAINGVGNFSMKYDSDTGLYYYNADYLNVGIYEYTIWVKDTSDNWNSNTGEFEIIETNPLFMNVLGLPGWSWIAIIATILIVIITFLILKKRGTEEVGIRIDEIFLIYHDGRLITHLTRRLKPDMDNEILSSMLVAVQSFVKDSFQGQLGENLDEMKYGELSILIATGKYLILATVVSGDNLSEMKDEITKAVEDMESNYKDILEDWDGEINKLQGIDKFLEEFVMEKD